MIAKDAAPTDRNVYIVDDDSSVRRSLMKLLRAAGFAPVAYATPLEFLEDCKGLPAGCVLLDVRMPGMDGLETQAELTSRGVDLPLVLMTAQGDITTAVDAMKRGAVDFIEKPFDDLRLINAITRSLDIAHAGRTREIAEAAGKVSSLSPREREVLDALVVGHSNKVIAHHLNISVRTVEVHRAKMLERLDVRGLGEAVRLAVMAGFTR
jgi:two-component system response regulator FixJ